MSSPDVAADRGTILAELPMGRALAMISDELRAALLRGVKVHRSFSEPPKNMDPSDYFLFVPHG